MKRSYDNMSGHQGGGGGYRGGRGRHGDDRRGSGRGGGGGRRGGHDDGYDRRGSYDDRRGGHDDRRGSYGRGYDDASGGGHDRDSYSRGYGDRRGSGSNYDDRRGSSGGYDDRRGSGSYGDRRGSGNYGDRRGSGGSHYGQSSGGRGGYNDRRDSYGSGGSGGGGGDHYGGGGGGGGGGGYGGGGFRGGGRGGGRGGRGGRGGGRGGRGRREPPPPGLSEITSCLSNVILADVTDGFQFYLYSVSCEDSNGVHIDSRHRRRFLFDLGFWEGLAKDMPKKEKDDLRRIVFFSGSFFFSGRRIQGLEPEKLPLTLPVGDKAEGDTIKVMQMIHYLRPVELQTAAEPVGENDVTFDRRCNDCTKAFPDAGALMQHCQQTGHTPVYTPETEGANVEAKPAQIEVFTSYVNAALQRALGERLARWGTEFIDPGNVTEPKDRQGNSLGVRVYEAFSCQFGCLRPGEPGEARSKVQLALTVDLRAKIVRTMSVLDHLCGNSDPGNYHPSFNEQERAKREWIGEVVISMHDKKCYSVTDLVFEHSAESMPIEGLGMSHADYFRQRKGIELKHPRARPMIAVLGRRNQTIFLPAELIAGNELERRVKEQLPMIASYKPEARNNAINDIRMYLVPGAQKSKGAGGLLPALGIVLQDERLSARAQVLPLPMMLAAGVEVPKSRADNWAPLLNRASFNVEPNASNSLNVVLVYNERLERGALNVFEKIRDYVNNYRSAYRFSNEPVLMIKAGDKERHWTAVERGFADGKFNPNNIFVLDFNKPKGATDPAYSVVKQMLTKNGFLSQFVNFNTHQHDNTRDMKRSSIILQGVARQILQKTGFRLWWVSIPKALPTPAVFIGVDVFHAPRVYDPVAKKRVAKASCAAIIVQVYRSTSEETAQVELYSETYAREPGKEYELGDALRNTVSTAMKELQVDPMSCVVWRDGIGDSAFGHAAGEEINAIREGLKAGEDSKDVPMAYVVCQKRIDTKFLSKGVPNQPDGKYGAPSGTLVQGIQGLEHETFYINGRAPPYSTAKPVRFIVVKRDDSLNEVPIPQLTWDLCHDYPNWTGPIKVPSVCQMAHKLAELGGGFADCGRSINANQFKNTVHFL